MYYIKGNKTRGAEVIKMLQDKGGILTDANKNLVDGTDTNSYYALNKDKLIVKVIGNEYKSAVRCLLNELQLPKQEHKFIVGDKIFIKNLRSVATIDKIEYDKSLNTTIYHYKSACSGGTFTADNKNFVKLNVSEWEPKRGDLVLASNHLYERCVEAIYSYTDETNNHIMMSGTKYRYCIPFELDKLGTTLK